MGEVLKGESFRTNYAVNFISKGEKSISLLHCCCKWNKMITKEFMEFQTMYINTVEQTKKILMGFILI
ncbi:CLUMA_CG010635, isoform A [Clunio marinus]|uniref:CLUMA_CG010635, isoform A n=1 Tax=Clunio marinus TaxID=568069 RepID=A0A1J1IAC9_9DIPT|nr:CLUMA_CG010635, isoform A [Clunio marinus]